MRAISKIGKELATVEPNSAAAAKLRELAVRDIEHAWNALLALTRFADTPSLQLQAAELMLAYAVGRPAGSPTIAATGNNTAPAKPKVDLASMSLEELQAIKTLQDAQRRRAEAIDALEPLPPLNP